MPKKTLLFWFCLLFFYGAAAQTAHYKLQEKGGNLLIQEVESGLYLNLFFSGDHLTLYSGTGDASQWKLLKADNLSEVKQPVPDAVYLLQTQMNSRKGQFAYLAEDKALSKAEHDKASEFVFVRTAKADVWQIRHKASGRFAQMGTLHKPILFAADGETSTTPTTPGGTLDPTKVYRIRWSQADNLFISERQGGALGVEPKSLAEKQYWKFTPVAGQTNTYTVQNTATGHYIQSCNLPPSSASKISAGETDIPYYVAQNPRAQVANGWYLSSTDCPNYADPAQSPRALNKDGASTSVITWMAGHANKGSYWWIEATTDEYEARPFLPGKQHSYLLLHHGQALESNAEGHTTWQALNELRPQTWWFDGESNAAGGYRIVSHLTGLPLNEGARYRLREENLPGGNGNFSFVDTQGKTLHLAGEHLFSFQRARTSTARQLGIYKLPCGAKNGLYLQHFSLAKKDAAPAFTYSTETKGTPGDYYVSLTGPSVPVTAQEEWQLAFSLNKQPNAETRIFLYFDWNQDGIFEQTYELAGARDITHALLIPQGHPEGFCRFRLRITDNDLTMADDDVEGEIVDGTFSYTPTPTRILAPRTSAQGQHIYDLRGIRRPEASEGIFIVDGTLRLHLGKPSF